MIGAVAQFERSLIGERVRAGIDNARKKGTILGRPALRVLNRKDIVELRRLRSREQLPFRKLAERFTSGQSPGAGLTYADAVKRALDMCEYTPNADAIRLRRLRKNCPSPTDVQTDS
jgi:DNA invertase Pin-like site-specific DNA recombinase